MRVSPIPKIPEKDIIEKARKAYKARCLAPYEAVEPKIKELVGMVERQRAPIDEIVKEHESRQKEAKEAEVRKYYDRKAVVLGDLAEELYPKLFDKKWTNASTRRAYYEEGVQAAINKAHDEIEAVKAMASPFTVPLLKVYAETLSMDAVREKNAELTAAVSAAGLTTAEEAAAAAGAAAPAPAVKEQPPASVEEGVAMRIYASQSDMSQLLDFMKAIGVRYEYL